MRIVEPVDVSETALVSSDVPVDDYPLWEAGTYTLGQRVINGIQAWEALADTTTQEPSASSFDWLRLGYVNRWRMFRDGLDSLSVQLDSISTIIAFPALVNTVAALGIDGAEVQLTVTDAVEGVVYDQTASLVDIGVADWWEYFFLPYDRKDTHLFTGVPPYLGSDYALTIRAASAQEVAAIGRVVAGTVRPLGVTNYGTSLSSIDYSTKDRDGFGNLTLVPRRTVKLIDYEASVSSQRVGFVQKQLSRLAATPTLFIGDELYDATIVYGVYRDFTEIISSPSISQLTLTVEGF